MQIRQYSKGFFLSIRQLRDLVPKSFRHLNSRSPLSSRSGEKHPESCTPRKFFLPLGGKDIFSAYSSSMRTSYMIWSYTANGMGNMETHTDICVPLNIINDIVNDTIKYH